MSDIDPENHLYRPKPMRRLAANMIEIVVDKCLEDVKPGAVPDAHHTITQDHRIWDLLTDFGTELKLSAIPGLETHFDMRLIIPRTFSAAVASGK